VYEDGAPSRVVLFNFVNDLSGASTYQASITTNSPSIHVRYLLAPTISEHDNITWAGQSMGGSYASDGRLQGEVMTQTITCNGVCIVSVPAPAIAVVYLTDRALALSSPREASKAGFETTIVGWGSATVDPKVLETSNGQNGPGLGRNNKAVSGAQRLQAGWLGIALLAVIIFV
jgi:hypothetical protein